MFFSTYLVLKDKTYSFKDFRKSLAVGQTLIKYKYYILIKQ